MKKEAEKKQLQFNSLTRAYVAVSPEPSIIEDKTIYYAVTDEKMSLLLKAGICFVKFPVPVEDVLGLLSYMAG